MEISHASAQNQSLTVGMVGKAHKVTVSTDAEFMMAVAHGIYSNKPLALVRELLCNARDGHFANGTPDAIIDVTLTDNKLVVRDHGTGIPNAVLPVNYTTFGKSTKRKLKNQTGGFGVGSKVPWAVCDTFTVRNFIEGKVTTYTVIKSDPTEDGEPTCTPVVSVPSSEPTGIEVIVPFPEEMQGDIGRYIYAFGSEMGLNIRLNGILLSETLVDTVRLKTLGYLPVTRHLQTVVEMQPIMVRLGDVFYPVKRQKAYQEAYDTVQALQGPQVQAVILQAEPDTITPTMSRESISYTDFSIESIKKLLINMLEHLATVIDDHTELLKEALPKAILEGTDNLYAIWHHNVNYRDHLRSLRISSDTVSEEAAMLLNHNASRWLVRSRPYLETEKSTAQGFSDEINKRVENGFYAFLKHRYLHQDSLYKIWKPNRETLSKEIGDFMQDEIRWWKAEMKDVPQIQDVWFITETNLHYYSEIPKTYLKGIRALRENTETKKYDVPLSYSVIQRVFASRLVILVSSMSKALDRFNDQSLAYPDLRRNVFSDCKAAFAGARIVKLSTPLQADIPGKLRAAYEKEGYVVLDLTKLTQQEIIEREEMAAERAAERAKPLPTLHSASASLIYRGDLKAFKHLGTNPKFKNKGRFYIVAERGLQVPSYLRSLRSLTQIYKRVGSDIVCVSTKPQISRVIKDGRVSLDSALVKIAKAFFAKPGIHEKMFYQAANQMRSNALKDPRFARLIYNRRIPHLTAEEEATFKILKEFSSYFPELSNYISMKVKLYQCSPIQVHYSVKENTYGDSKFIDISEVNRWAFYKAPSQKRKTARTILKTIHRK